MYAFRKMVKRFSYMVVPVARQEVVVKNINDHTRIFPVARAQSPHALKKYRVIIGEFINGTVKHYPFCDPRFIILKSATLHRVSNEIPYHQLILFTGKIKVGKKVHPGSYLQKRILTNVRMRSQNVKCRQYAAEPNRKSSPKGWSPAG